MPVDDPTNDPDAPGEPLEKPAEATPSRKSTVADRIAGGTTRMQKAVGEAASTAKKQADKTLVVLGVVGVVVVVGLIAIVLIARKKQPEALAAPIVPQFDNAMTSSEELRAFTRKTAQEVTTIATTMEAMGKRLEAIAERQDKAEKTLTETLERQSKIFADERATMLKKVEDYAKVRNSSQGDGMDPKAAAALESYRKTLATMTGTPAENRAKAAEVLRQAGIPDWRINDLLAEAAEQAGRINLGNVVEPPASDREKASLPTWLQSAFPRLQGLMTGLALTEGKLFPEQCYGDISSHLRANYRQNAQDINDQVIKQVADICRVRRENLTTEQNDWIPFLIAQRDAKGIKREDRAAVALLVHDFKNRYPADTNAGQMLSMAQAVLREIGAATRSKDAGPFRPIDTMGMESAAQVVASAARNAQNLNQNQADQYRTAQKALANYLETARFTVTPDQEKHLILRGMAIASGRSGNQVAVPAGGPATTEAPAPRQVESQGGMDRSHLYFGTLDIEKAKVGRGMTFAIAMALASNGIPIGEGKGIVASVTAWEQIPRISSAYLPKYLGQPLGAKGFVAESMPDLLTAARMGEAIGTGRFNVGGGGIPAGDDSRNASLVRGAVMGVLVGPNIHDEAKAKAGLREGASEIEAKPPYTPAVKTRLDAVPADRPWERTIVAYEAVRPGRFGYPAARFQDLVTRLTTFRAQAGDLEKALGDLAGREGEFAEAVRIFLPMALAVHDDGGPIDAVMDRVRQETQDYALLYAAERFTGRRVAEDMVARYAPAMGGIENAEGGQVLVAAAARATNQHLMPAFGPYRGKVAPKDIAAVARAIGQAALPLIERDLVRAVVVARVLPRFLRQGTTDSERQGLIDQLDKRVSDLVEAPYTPPRIDAWANQVTEEMRGTADRAGGARVSGPAGQASPQARPLSAWPAPTMLSGGGAGGPLVGITTEQVRRKKVVIPSGSYANAMVTTGVYAEVGGRNNLPITMRVDLVWNGPTSSMIPMRGAFVQGTANAMAGPERISVDVASISYVIPSSKRELYKTCKGYVADNLEGVYGLLGKYEWNWSKVMPMAVAAGAGQGAADALKAASTTTVVNSTTTVTAPSADEKLQYAITGGAAEGIGILADQVKTVLKDVHPSVNAKNGQPVSIILLEPVELDVTDSEYLSLLQPAGGF